MLCVNFFNAANGCMQANLYEPLQYSEQFVKIILQMSTVLKEM